MQVAASPERSLLPLTLGLVGDNTGGRLRKAMTACAAAAAAGQTAKGWWGRYVDAVTYTVSVPADDELYPDVHEWVLDNLVSRNRRAVTAHTQRAGGGLVQVSPKRWEHAPRLRLQFDGDRSQVVTVDGHSVKVGVRRPEVSASFLSSDEPGRASRWPTSQLVFTTRGPEGRDAVLALLGRLLADRSRVRKSRLFVGTRWGDWQLQEETPARALETVVLRRGQKEELVADLERFLASEATYGRLGLPWHRGYLFHGPPGTGKSSLAKALACHFELDLRFISVSAIQDDATLTGLLVNMPPRCVLILEDVDILHGARVRTDDQPGVTMAGLLQALDGLITPHGLVTVLTTNNLEVIDDALLRPGRVDKLFLVDLLDDDQLTQLVAMVLQRPVDLPPVNPSLRGRLSPADIIEMCKPYLDDPEAAIAALKEGLAAYERRPVASRGDPGEPR